MANEWPADYFISIHANSNVNPNIEGTEVYVYKAYTESYYLAEHVLNGIVNVVGTKDNGVRVNSSLYVLRRTRMPAILVELAYMSNYEDLQRLIDEQYGFAEGIYDGLLTVERCVGWFNNICQALIHASRPQCRKASALGLIAAILLATA